MSHGPPAYEDDGYAEAWERWFGVIEAAAAPVSQHLLERAEIRPGNAVLDMATGLGEPALSAARLCAPDGRVLAVDFSAAMLRRADARAGREGLDNVAFQEMDLNEPSFPAEAFDAAFCRWGLMFLADLESLLAQVFRSLKPGGRFAAAVWTEPERVPAIALSGRVVRQHLGLEPPQEGALSPFACADQEALERRLREAGFAGIESREQQVDYVFASLGDFVQFRKDLSGPLREEIAAFPQDEQDTAWQALAEAASDFADAEGRVRLANTARCISAQKPGAPES